MGRAPRTAGVAAALVVGLAGCAAASTAGSTAPSRGTPTPAAAATTTVPRPTTSSPPPHSSTIGGPGVRYASGLTVRVPSLEPFSPSSTAVGTAPDAVGVVATVHLSNGSGRALDAANLTVALAAGRSATLASPVFDAAQGYGTGFSGSLAPGASASAPYAFAVPKGAVQHIEVRVTPDLARPETSVFTGSLG